ncbi:unnamed protein product [Peniophora sp. CBMAI 1063]|nr:unnamed protein product [Peniophora sp. CBMAI 1063]
MARCRSLTIQEGVPDTGTDNILSMLGAGLYSRTLFLHLEQPTLERRHSSTSPASTRHISPEINELPEIYAPILTSAYLKKTLIPIPPSRLTYLRLDFTSTQTIETPYNLAQFWNIRSELIFVKPLLKAANAHTLTGISISEDHLESRCGLGLLAPGSRCHYDEEYVWFGPFADGHSERLLLEIEQAGCHPPHLRNIFFIVANSINCDAIETLDLEITAEYAVAAWLVHFKPFQNVATLHVDDMARTTVLVALRASGSFPPPLPRLHWQFLWISALDLQERPSQVDPPGASDDDAFDPFAYQLVDHGSSCELLPRLTALVPLVEVLETLAEPPRTTGVQNG